MGWVIESWDRELGVGTISSPRATSLRFDAAAALVDDFRVGELVEVELAREADAYAVVRVWPDDPRFVPRGEVDSNVPGLDPALENDARAMLDTLPQSMDFRWVGRDADLVLQGDDDGFFSGATFELLCKDVVYVECPARWDGKSIRLANDTERAYLATRCEMTAKALALRIVDDERRIYFVVCGALQRS